MSVAVSCSTFSSDTLSSVMGKVTSKLVTPTGKVSVKSIIPPDRSINGVTLEAVCVMCEGSVHCKYVV